MAIDFSKGVDFSPIEKLGINKQGGMRFLSALAPMIDNEFQTRIRSVFSNEELKAINSEAEDKGIKPEDGMFFMEEKYHAKTGRYFMEEMRLLFNEYIKHVAHVIADARKTSETFAKSEAGNVNQLEKLMNEEKWEEAAKLFDTTLNNKDSEGNKPPTP